MDSQVKVIEDQIQNLQHEMAKLEAKKKKIARGTADNMVTPVQVVGVRPPPRHRGKYTTILSLNHAPVYTAEVMRGGYQGALAAVTRFQKSGQLVGTYSVVAGPETLPPATDGGDPMEIPEGYVAVIKLGEHSKSKSEEGKAS